jgi:peptidoglycan/LPS O-acetylase OafA/YrhL
VYRRDIDGLRAVAIIPVVLFHFGMQRVPGGFVGVDVFFVISGYLITGIIFREIGEGTYSIVDFYDRRIRRIFPALITVLVACLVISFAFDLPSSMRGVSKATVATLLFSSNFYFNGVSGYFDQAVRLNPLLHTWSLAVEEQFYVVFPLFAFAIRNFDRKGKFFLLVSIAVVSLAWSIWLVDVDSSAAFYLPQSRAWELVLGSILTLGVIPEVRGWKAEATAIAGLALIIGSIVLLSQNSPFPGIGALAPCIGAAAIIHAGISTSVARVLSMRPMVGVGVMSYSMYLWHWPMVAFYRAFYGEPSRLTKVELVAALVAISAASLRYIERPFRSKPHLLAPGQTLTAGGLAAAALASVAIFAIPLAVSVRQIPAEVIAVDNYSKYNFAPSLRSGQCFLSSRHNDFAAFDLGTCLHIEQGAKNVLLIGDSHAAHLWVGLSTQYPAINFLQATSSGCKPIIMSRGATRCTDLINMVFHDFLPANHVDSIILSADWDDADLAEVEQTVGVVQQFATQVFVIGPSPSYTEPLPMILARQMLGGSRTIRKGLLRPEQIHIDEDFQTGLEHRAVRYISLYHALCNTDDECLLWAGKDKPLQFDSDHFTESGSVRVAQLIGPQMFAVGVAGTKPVMDGTRP